MYDEEMKASHRQRHEGLRNMFEEILLQMIGEAKEYGSEQTPTLQESVNKKRDLLLDTFCKTDESACNLFLRLMDQEERFYLVYFYDDAGGVDHHGEMTPTEAVRTAQGRRIRFFQEISKYDLRGKTDEERGVRVES